MFKRLGLIMGLWFIVVMPTVAEVVKERTVFMIVMENHNWDQIYGSASAPYINQKLLPLGAHAQQYYTPPDLLPSLPNYLWLEAGTNFGVTDNFDPARNHQASTDHLTALLDRAEISWKVYAEGVEGYTCPLVSYDHYAVKHIPMLYFDDVTEANDPNSAFCIDHIRPYSEFADDLANRKIARYNYLKPNTCNDMHDHQGCATDDAVFNGDTWLAAALPPILESQAYQNGGVIFITWDEGVGSEGPIGLIVLSPDAKPGYSNAIEYTHSSTLRTLQEIFDVQPFLGDAANATDLSDLFMVFP